MGSPDFALPSLKALIETFNVVGVVTKPDQKSGRGQKNTPSPIKKYSLSQGLNVTQPLSLKDPEFQEILNRWGPDLIVVAAFGKILPKSVLEFPEFGSINVHASLLPRWRGASPINAAILNGDKNSGVTIMKMAVGLDTGDIISQQSIPLEVDETAGTLFNKLSKIGAELLLKTIPDYINGEIQPQAQNDQLSTHAPMLKKEDGLIDPYKSAVYISRQVRAYNPWPGSHFKYDDKYLKIHNVRIIQGDEYKIESRIIIEKKPSIQTSDGIVIFEQVQKSGKKSMDGKEFLRGERNWEFF